MHWHDAVINDGDIVIDDQVDFNLLGENLELKNCRVVCRVTAGGLGFKGATLKGCHFKAAKRLTSLRWINARLIDSTFVGTYEGNDFGHSTRWNSLGSIERCDFSKAKLDACRFFECDASAMVLPNWPNYSIIDPSKRARVLRKAGPPPYLIPEITVCEEEESNVTIITGSLTRMKKLSEAEKEELKAFLQQFDFVVM